MAYTKLFASIVTSTIWSEDDKTRIVWITMLAIADKNGEIQASIPGLARVAGVSIADAEAAIQKFLSPDPYSRTPDDGGRRIEPIPGGWALLNHAKYRAMASKDEARESNAMRQRRFRDKERRNASVTESNATVTERHGPVTQDRDIAEAEAEAVKESIEESDDSSLSLSSREELPELDSETLAKQGKSLESISARLALPVENFIEHGKSLGLSEEKVRSWADSRVANGWNTAKGKSLTPVTWPADMAVFAAASQDIERRNNGKDHRHASRNDGTANAGRSSAFAGIGKRRP